MAGRHLRPYTHQRATGPGSSVPSSHTQTKAHLASFVLKEKQQPNCTIVPTVAHQVQAHSSLARPTAFSDTFQLPWQPLLDAAP